MGNGGYVFYSKLFVMKKRIKIIIPILFVCALGYFGVQIFTKIQHKKEVAENIKKIPKFDYQNIKGGIFSNANLNS